MTNPAQTACGPAAGSRGFPDVGQKPPAGNPRADAELRFGSPRKQKPPGRFPLPGLAGQSREPPAVSCLAGLCLRRQNLAALGAAGVQNPAATLGRHTGTEPMAAGANKVRRLKSAFHRDHSGSGTQTIRIREPMSFEARSLVALFCQVNSIRTKIAAKWVACGGRAFATVTASLFIPRRVWYVLQMAGKAFSGGRGLSQADPQTGEQWR